MIRTLALVVALVLLFAPATSAAPRDRIAELQAQIDALEVRVAALEGAAVPAPSAALALTCADTAGIERKFPCAPLPDGPVTAWDEFRTASYPAGAMVATEGVVRNENYSTQGDGHSTVGTGRDLEYGSTSCSAFDWRFDALDPTGYIIVWQLQMDGSPTAAISVSRDLRWFVKSRNGSDSGVNLDLGPVQFGRTAYFVACVTLSDDAGDVSVWMSHDGWPDGPPLVRRSGHDTWQGRTGHNTLGLYASHSSPGTYTGYFSGYGRAATPDLAVELVR